MSQRFFFGGLPTDGDVIALMRANPAVAGLSVSYEQISNIIKVAPKTARFRTVVNAWRRKVETEMALQSKCVDAAVVFMTADEAFDRGVTTMVRIRRQAGKAWRRAATITTAELTGDRGKRHELLVRETRAIGEAAGRAVATMAPPKPIASTTRTLGADQLAGHPVQTDQRGS